MDADAPLCLQRGRNSCGSRGFPQRDTVLALSRGLAGPTRTLLCASSWSLMTASKEKVSPFSWRKKKDVKQGWILQCRRINIWFGQGCAIYALSDIFLSYDVGKDVCQCQPIYSHGLPRLQIQPSSKPGPGGRWWQRWPSCQHFTALQ